MDTTHPIGVIIVSYNTCQLLRSCITSLSTCTLPLRVVVIDNGSPDGSAAMVRAEFPHVEVIALAHNVGFAAGTNRGIVRLCDANGNSGTWAGNLPDSLLLLNPDTIVHPGAIEALAAFLAAHPRVGAVGPRLLNSDGTSQPAAFRFPTLAMTLLDLFPPGEVLPGRLYGSWLHGRYPQEHGCEPFPIDHPLGACIMVRRKIVEQVGMLDEAFFMYAEEVDWCYRIRQAGWAIWQVPQARVTHVGGAATRQVRAKMLIALYESRLRFFRKHYSPPLVRWHTYLIHAGMLRATLVAWRDYLDGQIPDHELRSRLWAYGTIARM